MSRRGAAIAGNSGIPSAGPSTGGALPPAAGTNALVPGAALAPGQGNRISHTGGTWSDAYGGLGLPRPAADFTHGAFGPYPPILSMPIDEPDPATGQPEPRAEQYRVGWNLPVGTPGTEGLKLADFQTLQTLAELYSVARACIEYLKREITSLEWDILPTQDAAKAMKGSESALKDFGDRKAQAVKFLRRPDPDYFSWQTWLSAVLEEILVYDALSLVLHPKWGKGQGAGVLGSDLDCIRLISGPTIRPLYDMHGRTPRPPAVAYQQYLYGVPRVDLATMLTDRDLEMGALRGMEAQAFLGSQLIYLPMVPRRWTPYGFPPIERGLIPTITGLSKQGYQLDFFKEGTVPAVYISPGGDLSPNQIRELQDTLNAVAGDPAWHHKIIVLPSGSTVLPQRDAQLADQFDEIVMAQTCMAFGVQPMQIGIMPRVSTTSSPGAANQMAKQSNNTQDQATLQPHTIFLSVLIERILTDVLDQHDMRFVFAGMQEEEDQELLTNLIVNQWSHGMLTTDEARDVLGYQPFGLPETNVPVVLTATGVVPLTTSMQMAAAQLDQAQNPQPAPGAPVPGDESMAQDPGNNAGSPDEGTPPKKGSGSGGGSKPPTKGGSGNSGGKNNAAGTSSSGKNPQDSTTAISEGADESAQSGKGASNVGKAAAPDTPLPASPEQPTPPAPQTGSLTPQDAAQDAVEAAAAGLMARGMMNSLLDLYAGRSTLLQAFDAALMAIAKGYVHVYAAAGHAAVRAGHAATVPAQNILSGLAMQRAAVQQPFLLGLAQKVAATAQNGGDLSWVAPRVKLYGEGLHGAYQQGYGEAVKTSNPSYKLVWRLGDTEHCPLCLARDGKSFTFDTLPGWPGDGNFGGPICLGGPNCGCHIDYMEGDKVVTQGHNTQRPASIGYFAQQLKDITALRAKMHAERMAQIASLPNKIGSDGTSAQSRALARYELERRIAQLANQRIQASGGYPGISVEPQDIPASIIASLLPPGHEDDVQGALPNLMDAVEAMFAAKFSATDLTKTAFTQIILGIVAEERSDLRREEAELEACARHLIKGRTPQDWRCEKINALDVDLLSRDLKQGIARAQAVQDALRRRRYVTPDGQIIMPRPTQADVETAELELTEQQLQPGRLPGPASGGGGAYPYPHDANGIWHDLTDLKPTVRLRNPDQASATPVQKVGPKGYTHGWVKAGPVLGAGLKWDPAKDDVKTSDGHKLGGIKRTKGGYEAEHADGKKLGTFADSATARSAIAAHHNEAVKAPANYETEPELAGYHDALHGNGAPQGFEYQDDAWRHSYNEGRRQAQGSGAEQTLNSVSTGERFSRDADPEAAGDHDAERGVVADHTGRTQDYVQRYSQAWERNTGFSPAHAQVQPSTSASMFDDDDSDAASDERMRQWMERYHTANKVGPKGYIHGWIKAGPSGDSLGAHTDEHGNLTAKRSALHATIVDGITGGHAAKDKPTATFLGGGPASGKSTVMKDVGDSAVIDADGIKAHLPEYNRMIKSKDKRAASFVHEESSMIANKAMRAAAAKRIDFTLDGTGDSSFEKLSKKVAQARASGHSVAAKYVTVDTDEAVRRAEKRAARTGRMVPASVIKEIHASVSNTFKKAIDNNLFDTAELWDNNGSAPKLIGSKEAGGSWTVHDPEAWQRFLDKGADHG